jgi:hypothetical protein
VISRQPDTDSSHIVYGQCLSPSAESQRIFRRPSLRLLLDLQLYADYGAFQILHATSGACLLIAPAVRFHDATYLTNVRCKCLPTRQSSRFMRTTSGGSVPITASSTLLPTRSRLSCLTLSWWGTTTDLLESESIADGSSRCVPLCSPLVCPRLEPCVDLAYGSLCA